MRWATLENPLARLLAEAYRFYYVASLKGLTIGFGTGCSTNTNYCYDSLFGELRLGIRVIETEDEIYFYR